MNQGKVWRVVKPTVGVPLIIGGAVVAALIVHGALMIKTDWYGNYWNGGSLKGKPVAAVTVPQAVAVAPAPMK